MPMFKYLINGLLAGIGIKLLDHYRRLAFQLVKIEAAKMYLHGVLMARLSVISLMRMGLMIGLICIGMLLLHAGLFILLPWTVEVKAVIVMVLGAIYVVIGIIVLSMVMNEKTWVSKSGVIEMLNDASASDQGDKD